MLKWCDSLGRLQNVDSSLAFESCKASTSSCLNLVNADVFPYLKLLMMINIYPGLTPHVTPGSLGENITRTMHHEYK